MESYKLDTLPTELFDMVVGGLPPTDLPALRLVSRDSEWRVRRTYGEKCFKHLEVLLNSERSLKKALEVSQHPVFGGNVQKLTIHMDELATSKHVARKQKQEQLQEDVLQGSTKQDDIHVAQRNLLFEILTKNAKTLTTIRLKSASPPVQKMDWSNKKSKAYRRAASQALHPPKANDRRAFAIVVGAMADALKHDPGSYNISSFSVDKCDGGWSFPVHGISTDIAVDTVKSWLEIQAHFKSLEVSMDFSLGHPLTDVDLSATFRAFGTNMPQLEVLTVNVAPSTLHIMSNYPMLLMLTGARLPKIRELRRGLGLFLQRHKGTIEKVVVEGCCFGGCRCNDGGVKWVDRKEKMKKRYPKVEVVA
ncbi:hypothetical protein AC578_9587 [Pseudocercospora eumusae]|uniref:F-box domain-containing protein n=1 Tax=Pseudocercospora eumusae TaxID=321146 RepID=A0A139GY12_9PEZI|nr:hypothetical protein AC578_9587 [Pseudocercospora eumusae]